MARKITQPAPEPEPELKLRRDEAAAKLADRISKGQQLSERQIGNSNELDLLESDSRKWSAYNRDLLITMFTTHKFEHEYAIAGVPIVMSIGFEQRSLGQLLSEKREYIATKLACMDSIVERLELIPLTGNLPPTEVASSVAPQPREHTNRAFIVHGHDEATREKVARLMERLGVTAVILHEQATGGRTIVEKLEHYSAVDFAVILFTGDDVGAVKLKPDELQPRARQNVVLELGYFVGLLTRAKVCALYQKGVEMPSDYLSVGYIELDDAGAWQVVLARELRNAGFAIDMNKL